MSFRDESSCVAAVKTAYRDASKLQRAQMRAWMRRVLSDVDGSDKVTVSIPGKTAKKRKGKLKNGNLN